MSRLSSLIRVMFVQKRHPITGTLEWEVLTEATDEQRDCLSNSLYLDMLNDSNRNRCYQRAIEKSVQPVSTVLDIGTGSGLLSLMASKFVREGKIVACETFPPMARMAEKIVERNRLVDKIEVIQSRSDDLDLEKYGGKFDVILTEIFDSELIGEGLLSTMRHAIRNLVKEDFVVVPARATVYFQIVQSAIMSQWKAESPKIGEMNFFKEMDVSPLYPRHLIPLTEPARLFVFDLANPPSGDRSIELKVPVVRQGQVDAAILWWDIDCDRDGEIQLSSRPSWVSPVEEEQKWRVHWKQCWAPLPTMSVMDGNDLVLSGYHDDVSFSLGTTGISGSIQDRDHHRIQDRSFWVGPLLSSRRIWELRDSARNERYRMCLHRILDQLKTRSGSGDKDLIRILVLGEECVFGDLLLSRLEDLDEKPIHVIVAQETVAGFKKWCALADGCIWLRSIRLDDLCDGNSLNGVKFDLVLAEPYFWNQEGHEPWFHYLTFRHYMDQLKDLDLLSADFVSFPASDCWSNTGLNELNGFQLNCCGVSMPELSRTRSKLELTEGWDLSLLNEPLGAIGVDLPSLDSIPLSLWQCGPGVQILTRVTTLTDVDFQMDTIVNLDAEKEGDCDAILIWPSCSASFGNEFTELVFGLKEPKEAPDYSVYGVCLLGEPIRRSEAVDMFSVKLHWNPETLKIKATPWT